MPWTKHVHKRQRKGLHYREIGNKFDVGASVASEKVNTSGTDETLFILEPEHGGRVLPLELALLPVHQQKAVLRLVRAPSLNGVIVL